MGPYGTFLAEEGRRRGGGGGGGEDETVPLIFSSEEGAEETLGIQRSLTSSPRKREMCLL